MQTGGIGEGWNSFDSGHYMSARLRAEDEDVRGQQSRSTIQIHWTCRFIYGNRSEGEVCALTRFMLECDAVTVAAVAAVFHGFAFAVALAVGTEDFRHVSGA